MLRRPALAIAAISTVLVFTLAGCSGSSRGDEAKPAATGGVVAGETTTEAPAEPETAGLNTPVTVGDFEFTATGASDIGTTIGEAPLSQDAQGTYIQVDLSVKNVGKKGEMFFSTYVKLIDANGNEYDADTMASIYLKSESWASNINPGNTATGPIVFDVPAGTVAVSIKVTDNMFSSDGELINLG